MNRIAQFAVKYPVTVLMLVLGIVLLGVISLGKPSPVANIAIANAIMV